MRIQVVIPLWKRPDVTKFCFGKLLQLIGETKHELRVLCVISESEYIKVCDEFGFNWIYADNKPLGAKINKGIRRALESKWWDYLMMMNSDDVIKAELLDKYYDPFFEKQERFFGISTVTYVNFHTGEAREFDYEYSVLGIGKCIRRDVVEQMGGHLYTPDLNKCLDDTMMDNLMRIKVFPRMVRYKGQLAMDFKSEVNIHPWEKFKDKGRPVDYVA